MTTGAPQPGTILAGKYRVEEVLGVGGMGVVVAAHHIQLDQRVAIKYLLPDAIRNQEVVERFAREARAAAKIRGEHVARVIDVGQFDDGTPFIIMEYLEGHDLAKELATNAPLRLDEVTRYILEACEALAEAHVARIVHRDLKPQNLFLAKRPDRRSSIKVLDFGISKVETDTASAALTRTSALMGTAYYMSPEQMTTPKLVDHRSDIWSLGVIMYELLAGRPPFPGETVAEIIAGILTNEPEPLRKHRPDVPQELAAVITRCMQSKPVNRFQNVAALAGALAPFASPAERGNVDRISRVLGAPASEPMPAATVALAHSTGPRTPITPISGNPQKTMPSSPPPASHVSSSSGQVPGSLPSPASYSLPRFQNPTPPAMSPHGITPMTNLALARSSSELESSQMRSRRSPALWIVLGLFSVVGLLTVGFIVWKQQKTPASAPAVGLVSSAANDSRPPAAGPEPSSTTVIVSNIASVTTPPVPSGPTAATAGSATSPHHAASRTSNVTLPPVRSAPTSTASTPPVPPPATTSTVPTPPAVASSAPKKPLQMDIK